MNRLAVWGEIFSPFSPNREPVHRLLAKKGFKVLQFTPIFLLDLNNSKIFFDFLLIQIPSEFATIDWFVENWEACSLRSALRLTYCQGSLLVRYTTNTKGKECGSILSSLCWGRVLRDDTKNGCVTVKWMRWFPVMFCQAKPRSLVFSDPNFIEQDATERTLRRRGCGTN